MKLLTESQHTQLLANGKAQRAAIDRQDQALDFKPVVWPTRAPEITHPMSGIRDPREVDPAYRAAYAASSARGGSLSFSQILEFLLKFRTVNFPLSAARAHVSA
jgi:hypothetical protein